MRHRSQKAAWFATVWVLAWAATAAEYEVVDLGTLGGDVSEAWGINDVGQIVGWALDTNGLARAFLWENGRMTDLGAMDGGTQSWAYGVNNAGVVVGRSTVSNSAEGHAFAWRAGEFTDLGTRGGSGSGACGVNDSGAVVGWFRNPFWTNVFVNPFLWETGQMIDLECYHGYNSGEAYALNSFTQVVGITFAWTPDDSWEAFVWEDLNGNKQDDDGEMKILGTFGGRNSCAFDINDRTQLVGWADLDWTTRHAFVLSPSNGVWRIPPGDLIKTNALMADLGTLGGRNSRALAINAHGAIVGDSTTATGETNAFLWKDGVLVNLNERIATNSGWVLETATDINSKGEIVGIGNVGGKRHGFLLTAPRRILEFFPAGTYAPGGVFTNENGQVLTQTVFTVEGLVLRWSSVWELDASNFLFTVEASLGADGPWWPYPPTNQWPVTGTSWTCPPNPAVRSLWLRVRGEPPL